jgi:uroporphyrinogen decarboxylase
MAEEYMTPRERWETTCSFKEPDRVPIDFGGLISTILDAGPYGYRALAKHLGIDLVKEKIPVYVAYILNTVANVDERILNRLHADTRKLFMPNAEGPITFDADGALTVWGGIRLKAIGNYYDPFDFPLADAKTIEDLENYDKWPNPADPMYYEGAEKVFKDAWENTDYAITCIPGYSILLGHNYAFMRGFDQWLMDMKLNPEFYHAMMSKILEIDMEFAERTMNLVGDYCNTVLVGDDMGTQEGPFMSPEMFREFMKPYMKKLYGKIKSLTKARVQLHTCGSVYPLIPDIIDAGVDIINPIQPLAKNMEPWRLKKEFHGKVVLHGGLDVQKMMAFGTPDEIREGAKEYLKIMAPGGGYIAAGSHNMEPETPPENIVTLFDTVYEYGRYPIAL